MSERSDKFPKNIPIRTYISVFLLSPTSFVKSYLSRGKKTLSGLHCTITAAILDLAFQNKLGYKSRELLIDWIYHPPLLQIFSAWHFKLSQRKYEWTKYTLVKWVNGLIITVNFYFRWILKFYADVFVCSEITKELSCSGFVLRNCRGRCWNACVNVYENVLKIVRRVCLTVFFFQLLKTHWHLKCFSIV